MLFIDQIVKSGDFEFLSDFYHRMNEVQKSIYIVDILKRFVVPCPSCLKEKSLSELRMYFYSESIENFSTDCLT